MRNLKVIIMEEEPLVTQQDINSADIVLDWGDIIKNRYGMTTRNHTRTIKIKKPTITGPKNSRWETLEM